MLIVPLSRELVGAVARLHCCTLKGLLSTLGVRAVRAYYLACIESPSAVALVCVEHNMVCGFVLGSADPTRLRAEVLRAAPVRILLAVCWRLVAKPSTGWHIFRHIRGPEKGGYDDRAAELIYLAVSSDARGRGVGQNLVDAFTQRMRDAGAGTYELSADDDNALAINFYEKREFQLITRFCRSGVWRRRYRLNTVQVRP